MATHHFSSMNWAHWVPLASNSLQYTEIKSKRNHVHAIKFVGLVSVSRVAQIYLVKTSLALSFSQFIFFVNDHDSFWLWERRKTKERIILARCTCRWNAECKPSKSKTEASTEWAKNFENIHFHSIKNVNRSTHLENASNAMQCMDTWKKRPFSYFTFNSIN